jgi:Transposase DDE domain
MACIATDHAGRTALYSNLAIELVLILRLVFRLGLRQAEGFASSVLRLLGLDLPVPDHTTLSRRGRTLPIAGRRSSRTAPCTCCSTALVLELFPLRLHRILRRRSSGRIRVA